MLAPRVVREEILRIRHACQTSQGRRRIAVVAMASLLPILAVSAGVFLRYEAQRLREEQLAAKVQAQEERVRQEKAQEALGFLRNLPAQVDAQRLSSRLASLAIENKVSLSSLKIRSVAQSPQNLPHQRWDLELQGSYPKVKAYLADAVQGGELYALELDLQRMDSGDVQAKVVLVAWQSPRGDRP